MQRCDSAWNPEGRIKIIVIFRSYRDSLLCGMGKIQLDIRGFQKMGPGTQERIVSPEACPILKTHHIELLGISTVKEGEFDFCRPNWTLQQVLVVLSGKGRGWIDGEWQSLTAGSAYLTPAHTPHAYQACGKWEIGWCTFSSDAFPDFQERPLIRETNPAPWFYIFSGLLEESIRAADPLQLERWVGLLHHECAQLIVHNKGGSQWRLWKHVLESLDTQWTLPSLASKAGVHPETLRLQCQHEFGMSPMTYLTRLRMHHAAALLETGQKIAFVAGQVGYQNQFAFSTAFRRVIGTTPSSLRKSRAY